MSQTTLLVADNDRDFLILAQVFLERRGYRVIAAHDVPSAREALERQPLALALLDYRLVDDGDQMDQSGLSLAKAYAHAFSVPKIILTRIDNAEAAVEALRPSHGQRPPAVNFVLKQKGLEAMAVAIEQELSKANVFMCYARADQDRVGQLYDDLSAAGFTPWMDSRDLEGGETYTLAIERAIQQSDCCLVCWSAQAAGKRGHFQRDLRLVLDRCSQALEDDICVVPIRLDQAEVTHEALRSYQWVDLAHPDGFQRVVRAIRASAHQRRRAP